MGGGSWTSASYNTYRSTTGIETKDLNYVTSTQAIYKANRLNAALNPKNIMRECRDSKEHPNTFPVIIGLDVTGSMGTAAQAIAKQLNEIVTDLYDKVPDVEFCFMGIGDLYCDEAPIQMTQFESDVRIAEQLEKIYFEGGGGGNAYESYTSVWYMALKHTILDCWTRGKKGLIITLGDEPLNPFLQKPILNDLTGDKNQEDILTEVLYPEVIEKFDVYHFMVDDHRTSYHRYADRANSSWGKYLDAQHLKVITCDNLKDAIVDVVVGHSDNSYELATDNTPIKTNGFGAHLNEDGEIVW